MRTTCKGEDAPATSMRLATRRTESIAKRAIVADREGTDGAVQVQVQVSSA